MPIVHRKGIDTIFCSCSKLIIGIYNLQSSKNNQTATNKDRSCERSEPRSYPLVGQARH